MERIVTFISVICICISFVGCAKSTPIQSNIQQKSFDQAQAVVMVVKNHPDFPFSPSDTKIEKLPTGGPQGTTADVKFTTAVMKVGDTAYIVTLTKDWGITVNGKYVKSIWKYSVNPSKVIALESVDNDRFPMAIK